MLPGNLFEPSGMYRFQVIVDGVFLAIFTECTLPTLEVETLPITEGGQNEYIHQLPVRVKPGSVSLKNGVLRNSQLLTWYLQVMSGDIESATRQVTVMVFDSMNIPITVWNFRQAFPTKWTGPTLRSDDSAVGIEQIDFVFHDFIVG